MLDVLRITGKFLSVNRNVISSADFCPDTNLLQCIDHRGTKCMEVQFFHISGIRNKGKIHISHVVVNCPAPGQSAYYRDPMLSDIRLIDLLRRILVFAHNDRIMVLP